MASTMRSSTRLSSSRRALAATAPLVTFSWIDLIGRSVTAELFSRTVWRMHAACRACIFLSPVSRCVGGDHERGRTHYPRTMCLGASGRGARFPETLAYLTLCILRMQLNR